MSSTKGWCEGIVKQRLEFLTAARLGRGMDFPLGLERTVMREKMVVACSIFTVFAIQASFRAMMLLRRWNY
jgi:hypothetical protein